ncbi:hypothetical protein EGW08_007212 [Elysia chlorotica]|uniref:Uncharacterized protein n=1 Tax=Elysia chlorotica TaxID=188477 RepID=A0A433TTY5_ELYCH|nr:hypothetical protein EGW08_007212 [Elysia chlorotica]
MMLLSLAALLVMASPVLGQGYELDPQKLNQRYNLIQNLVQAGIPRKGSRGHKAKSVPIVTQANRFGSVLGSQYKSPAYSQQAAVPYGYSNAGYGQVASPAVYGTPKTYGGYDVSRLYAPRQAGGYGYASTIPNYRTAVGYKLGGGAVHPLFDNKNIYKPKSYGDIYGNLNSQEPIYLGGSDAGFAPKENALVAAKPVPVPNAYPRLDPQFNAYDYRGQPQAYAGPDVLGGYTGQQGTLYGGLPGYSNQEFSQY